MNQNVVYNIVYTFLKAFHCYWKKKLKRRVFFYKFKQNIYNTQYN